MYYSFIVFAALFGAAYSQFANGRILEPPEPHLCAKRIIHERGPDGLGYYYSWRDPVNRQVEEDWLGARNHCRKMCMDSVSLETHSKNEWIKQRVVADKVKYIWTSGRLCDFKGCEARADLQPYRENSWSWTNLLLKLPNVNNRAQNDWSESGGIQLPQPDNREFRMGGTEENCLALLNNFYNDGVHWHDIACHHLKPWVCQESPDLINYVRHTNPNLRI